MNQVLNNKNVWIIAMMKLWTTKQQYLKLSLSSKLMIIGTYVGIILLLLLIYMLFNSDNHTVITEGESNNFETETTSPSIGRTAVEEESIKILKSAYGSINQNEEVFLSIQSENPDGSFYNNGLKDIYYSSSPRIKALPGIIENKRFNPPTYHDDECAGPYPHIDDDGTESPASASEFITIDILYPEFIYLKNISVDKVINSKIRKNAGMYDIPKSTSVKTNYEITYRSDNLIAIVFLNQYMGCLCVNSTHTYKTLILNINSGNEYRLFDIIDKKYQKEFSSIAGKYNKRLKPGNEIETPLPVDNSTSYSFDERYFYLYYDQYELYGGYYGYTKVNIPLYEITKFIIDDSPLRSIVN